MANPLSGLYFALIRDMEDLRDIIAYVDTTIKTADEEDSSLQ